MKNRNNVVLATFFILLMFACNSKGVDGAKEPQETRIENVQETAVVESQPFSDKDSIQILKVSDVKIEKDAKEFSDKCKSWNLNSDSIIKIVRLSERISGEDMHHLYYRLPCEINGKLKWGSRTYDFMINAGSFLHLSSTDTSFYLGCSKKECQQYFLMSSEDM